VVVLLYDCMTPFFIAAFGGKGWRALQRRARRALFVRPNAGANDARPCGIGAARIFLLRSRK